MAFPWQTRKRQQQLMPPKMQYIVLGRGNLCTYDLHMGHLQASDLEIILYKMGPAMRKHIRSSYLVVLHSLISN